VPGEGRPGGALGWGSFAAHVASSSHFGLGLERP
jgi:hypothetical protein